MKRTIIFVCVENSCRSQMAEGFARFYGKNVIEAYSAGSNPSGKINPSAIEVMREAGIDISSQFSKGFKDLPVSQFDYVVTMGCHDLCPFIPAKKNIEWDIDDPKGKPLYSFRQVREKIRDKIRHLIIAIITQDAQNTNEEMLHGKTF
jgi:arsenate reductase